MNFSLIFSLAYAAIAFTGPSNYELTKKQVKRFAKHEAKILKKLSENALPDENSVIYLRK